MFRFALFFGAFLCVCAHAQQSEMRTWTSASGKTLEARLVSESDGIVTLLRSSGKTLRIRRRALSQADQAFLDASPRPPTRGISRSPRRSVASDWATWRGRNRDGKSPDVGLLKSWPEGGPELLWRNSNIGEGYSSIAVTGGRIYTSGVSNNRLEVIALDMDGNPVWKVDHGPAWTNSHPGSRATPTIDGDSLYLLSGKGRLVCYNTRDGKELWDVDMADFGAEPGGWGYTESVLALPDKLIVSPGQQYSMVALDKRTGRPKWRSKGNGGKSHYSSTILANHRGVPMLINGNQSGIFAVDPSNGQALWSNRFSEGNTANCPTPVYSDGYVFWSNGYGKGGICLQVNARGRSASASEAWRTRDLESHHGGYIVHEGHIYGNHNSGWTCLDLRSGERKWFDRGVGKGSVTYADGMLYTFGESGGRIGLVECRPDSFVSRGEFRVQGNGPSWSHPVVIGGRLYLRYASNLYCYDIRAN